MWDSVPLTTAMACATERIAVGAADACATQLLAFRAAGCTHLVLSLVRDEREPPEPGLAAFAAEVLPRLRAAVTAT